MHSPKKESCVRRGENQGQNPGENANSLKRHIRGEPMQDTPQSTRKLGVHHRRQGRHMDSRKM